MKKLLRSILGVVLISGAARAQDQSNVSAARQIAVQGLQAFDEGRFAEAAEKLGRAYDVVRVPTVGLYRARALEKVGKLVEAAELLLEITRLEVADHNRNQEIAREDAAKERQDLIPRIPKLTVQVTGITGEAPLVDVNGTRLPVALIGAERWVNPGPCQVSVRDGVRAVREEITLAEGESRVVTMTLVEPTAVAPVVPQAVSTPETIVPPPAPPRAATHATTQRTVGWITLGLGGSGLAIGGIAAVLGANLRSSLDAEGCRNGHCYVEQSDDLSSYNSMRVIASVGFIGGAAAIGGGVLLILTAPSRPPDRSAPVAARPSVSPWVGLNSVGMSGRF